MCPLTNSHTAKNASHTKTDLKQGVLKGSISSAAWDTACTSNVGKIGNPFIKTSQPSVKVFSVADGRCHAGTNIEKLHHPVQEPARTVDMIPALADQYLISGSKFSDAGYISIYNGEEVIIYDGRTSHILVSETSFLRLWKCPCTKLWRVPLQTCVTNLNTHTLPLD